MVQPRPQIGGAGLAPQTPREEAATPMRVLFLDNDERRQKQFRRDAAGASIERAYGARYLDFDLDDDPGARKLDDYESGQVVADWLAENPECRRDCLFVIHSRCEEGAAAMNGALRSAGLRVVIAGWTWRAGRRGSRRD